MSLLSLLLKNASIKFVYKAFFLDWEGLYRYNQYSYMMKFPNFRIVWIEGSGPVDIQVGLSTKDLIHKRSNATNGLMLPFLKPKLQNLKFSQFF